MKKFNPTKHVVVVGDELCIANALLDIRRSVVAAYELDDGFAILLPRRIATKYFKLDNDDLAVYLFSVDIGGEDVCAELIVSHTSSNEKLSIEDVIEFAQELYGKRYLFLARN